MQLDIIGRNSDDNCLDTRANTKRSVSVEIPYQGGACGVMKAEMYLSEDAEDRGGVVLRITNKDIAQSFIPHAKDISNGIELHMAGDTEAVVFIEAVQELLRLYASTKNKFHPTI